MFCKQHIEQVIHSYRLKLLDVIYHRSKSPNNVGFLLFLYCCWQTNEVTNKHCHKHRRPTIPHWLSS